LIDDQPSFRIGADDLKKITLDAGIGTVIADYLAADVVLQGGCISR
jgi:hypothetical protein